MLYVIGLDFCTVSEYCLVPNRIESNHSLFLCIILCILFIMFVLLCIDRDDVFFLFVLVDVVVVVAVATIDNNNYKDDTINDHDEYDDAI